jgi:hypothetical protein
VIGNEVLGGPMARGACLVTWETGLEHNMVPKVYCDASLSTATQSSST